MLISKKKIKNAHLQTCSDLRPVLPFECLLLQDQILLRLLKKTTTYSLQTALKRQQCSVFFLTMLHLQPDWGPMKF